MKSVRRLRRAVSRVVLEAVESRLLMASINGTYFYDTNLNGTQDAGEAVTAGGRAYVDANANGQFDGTLNAVASTDLPKAITDNTTITSNLNVAGFTNSLTDVNVSLSLTHSYVGDLNIYLISPAGTRVELMTRVGAGGDNIDNLTLDDQAAASITTGTAPYTNMSFRPEGSLAVLNGAAANGQWKLEVGDAGNGDVGSLTAWSLSLSSGEQSATSNASGAFSFVNLAAGSYTVRSIPVNGFETVSVAQTVNLPTATSTATVRFGHRQPPATATGVLFGDYDNDGVRDAGEPGLAGLTVYHDANNSLGYDAGELTAVTDSNGIYNFSLLIPGAYRFRVLLPSGFTQTSPLAQPRIGNNVNVPVTPALDSSGKKRDFVKDEVVIATKLGAGLIKTLGKAFGTSIDVARSSVLIPGKSEQVITLKLKAGVNAEAFAEQLRTRSDVAWASFNYIYNDIDPREVVPNDPQVGSQYQHALIQNLQAWEITRGAGVKVGVTDDGIALDHPDLSPNIYSNPAEIAGNNIDDDGNGYVDDYRGWDFTNSTATVRGDNNPNPALASDDHGTHVAGIIGAKYNNGVGVAGVAGDATLVPLRFYGTGTWTSTVVSNAYRYAADNGIKIVSTSYNVDGFVADPIFLAAVEYMYDNGVLHLNSAGNNNELNPARQAIDSSLYVASTEADDTRSSFSNYGTGIDISAPGGNILSTALGASLTTYTYELKSGTSMATPMAAGVAALIWAAHPNWTRDQVAAQLIGSADDISAANPTLTNLLGSGRVNSYRGVAESLAPPTIDGFTGLPAEGSTVTIAPTSFTLDLFSVLSPASANNLTNYKLIGAGLDNTFGTGDDTSISLTRTLAEYRIGTNLMTFNVTGTLGPGQYRVVVESGGIVDPFGQFLDGNGDGIAGDDMVRSFSISPFSVAIDVTLAPSQSVSGLNFGLRDSNAPTVASSLFDFQDSQNVKVTFSKPIAAPTASQLVLTNTNTGAVINVVATPSYDAVTRTATFTFATPLANGNYTASVNANDLYGNALDGNGDGVRGDPTQVSFFTLVGDADHDRRVGFSDLVLLAGNYNKLGRTFAQGDFNYSANGVTDFADLVLLAGNYNKRLNEDGTITTGAASRPFGDDWAAAQGIGNSKIAALSSGRPPVGAAPVAGRVAGLVFSNSAIGVMEPDAPVRALLA